MRGQNSIGEKEIGRRLYLLLLLIQIVGICTTLKTNTAWGCTVNDMLLPRILSFQS